MRIIYIHQYYLRPDQGGAVRSFHLSQGLAKEGIKVEVITAHNKKAYKAVEDGDVKVHYLPVPYRAEFSAWERILAFYRFYKQAKSLIRTLQSPDLFYISSTPLTTGWIGVWAKKTWNIPFVFEVRDLWPEAPIQVLKINNPIVKKLLYKVESKIYRRADKIVSLSPGIQSYIKSRFPEKRVALIPNFSDNDFFRPKDLTHETRDFARQPMTFLYSGAIGEVNGLDQFLDLALEAKKLGKNWHFKLMGDGNALESLKERTLQLALNNVFFIPFANKIAVKKQLEIADLAYISFLPLKALESSSPNKFFDALAIGLPVVVNFKGWIYELILNENIGLFHDSEEAKLIIQELEKLEKKPSLLYQMGQKSRQIAENNFDKKEAQQKLLAFLAH
ncbi:glycosyltransferase family 4 protein [uncultured Cyclobacterium sp.]|uniref:glycosyltransferase family 4 protein n=1 Tax=uncultured Cyclobacterium sp. TaxID=453820 RepID=UPI0030EB67E8|tara:strand:- start:176156 stop:177325 length:1170 start_codon:yes stop_codon:yes gene_type:complete